MKASHEATPVFGLTKGELWPIVEEAAGTTVASFDVLMEHGQPLPHGGPTEKEIPTFAYITKSGREGRVTIFAKRITRPGPSEVQQYRFLQAHHAPIPRLYGVLLSPEGSETLFLEHVDMRWEARSHRTLNQRREFFALMARFHAIQPSKEYAAWLDQTIGTVTEELSRAEPALDLIWKHACDGELGQSLQDFCSSYHQGLRELQSLATHVTERCLRMPQGLTHTDLLIENVGRRHNGELVLLDLEWVRRGPRFFDAAGWLGRPPDRWPPSLAQSDLARHYLEEYARWGGSPPSLEAFLDDVRLMWLAENLRILNWYRDRAVDGLATSDANEDTRRARRDSLYRRLTMLLAQYRLRGTKHSALDRW